MRNLALGVILVVGLALRLLYLGHVTSQPGFVWIDPDNYMAKGEKLASGSDGWRFDFDAVEHAVEGRRYALPPLYPVFLSIFALFPGYPLNAQVGQAVLATLAIALVFLIGREVHSDRAGLWSAAFYALWLPNILAVWSTMQETLFVPLVLLGFFVLLRARTFPGFALAGFILGFSALTRSMPVYFLPVAAVLVARSQGIRRGALLAGALVLGFASVTVPYSVALSRHLGAPTFIENHGGLRVARDHGAPGVRPPGLIQTATSLLEGFAERPRDIALEWVESARAILYVNGGRLLQIYLGAETRLGSALWKLAAHLFGDMALVAVLLLAPFGLALCRRPDRGAFLAAWAVLSFGLTVLSGFSGPRLRASFEPHLMVLAAVVPAGEYRRSGLRALAASTAVSLVLAGFVLPQLPRSFQAKGDYGVGWPLDPPPKRSRMIGTAGFNVLAEDGFVELEVRPRNPGRATAVSVSLEGELAEKSILEAAEHRFRLSWPRDELVYVELEASDVESGEPVRMFVVVPK